MNKGLILLAIGAVAAYLGYRTIKKHDKISVKDTSLTSIRRQLEAYHRQQNPVTDVKKFLLGLAKEVENLGYIVELTPEEKVAFYKYRESFADECQYMDVQEAEALLDEYQRDGYFPKSRAFRWYMHFNVIEIACSDADIFDVLPRHSLYEEECIRSAYMGWREKEEGITDWEKGWHLLYDIYTSLAALEGNYKTPFPSFDMCINILSGAVTSPWGEFDELYEDVKDGAERNPRVETDAESKSVTGGTFKSLKDYIKTEFGGSDAVEEGTEDSGEAVVESAEVAESAPEDTTDSGETVVESAEVAEDDPEDTTDSGETVVESAEVAEDDPEDTTAGTTDESEDEADESEDEVDESEDEADESKDEADESKDEADESNPIDVKVNESEDTDNDTEGALKSEEASAECETAGTESDDIFTALSTDKSDEDANMFELDEPSTSDSEDVTVDSEDATADSEDVTTQESATSDVEEIDELSVDMISAVSAASIPLYDVADFAPDETESPRNSAMLTEIKPMTFEDTELSLTKGDVIENL